MNTPGQEGDLVPLFQPRVGSPRRRRWGLVDAMGGAAARFESRINRFTNGVDVELQPTARRCGLPSAPTGLPCTRSYADCAEHAPFRHGTSACLECGSPQGCGRGPRNRGLNENGAALCAEAAGTMRASRSSAGVARLWSAGDCVEWMGIADAEDRYADALEELARHCKEAPLSCLARVRGVPTHGADGETSTPRALPERPGPVHAARASAHLARVLRAVRASAPRAFAMLGDHVTRLPHPPSHAFHCADEPDDAGADSAAAKVDRPTAHRAAAADGAVEPETGAEPGAGGDGAGERGEAGVGREAVARSDAARGSLLYGPDDPRVSGAPPVPIGGKRRRVQGGRGVPGRVAMVGPFDPLAGPRGDLPAPQHPPPGTHSTCLDPNDARLPRPALAWARRVRLKRSAVLVEQQERHAEEQKAKLLARASRRRAAGPGCWDAGGAGDTAPALYWPSDDEDAVRIDPQSSMPSRRRRSGRGKGAAGTDAPVPPPDLLDDPRYDYTGVDPRLIDELRSLRSMRDGVLREVRVRDVHVEICCDVCGVDPIIGKRWTCVDCKLPEMFDLCGACADLNGGAQEGALIHGHPSDHRLALALAPDGGDTVGGSEFGYLAAT